MNELQEIFILTKTGRKKIMASPIKIKGLEHYKLFVHKSIDEEDDQYTLTEESTGMVFSEARTEEKLIKNAENLIERIGIEAVDKSVEKARINAKLYEDEFYVTLLQCKIDVTYIQSQVLKEKLIEKGIIK